jgi:hypothetical protein
MTSVCSWNFEVLQTDTRACRTELMLCTPLAVGETHHDNKFAELNAIPGATLALSKGEAPASHRDL